MATLDRHIGKVLEEGLWNSITRLGKAAAKVRRAQNFASRASLKYFFHLKMREDTHLDQ
jgi:hypothetical protein